MNEITIEEQAKQELKEEIRREAVEKHKEKLRKSFWSRFPFITITIRRK